MIKNTFLLFLLLVLSTLNYGQSTSFKEYEELGDVHWLRNFDAAKELAKKENKSIFILFQEVPGCATCRNYGQNVLTHPLIIDAIETHFIPLCIFNNTGGDDRKTLTFFKEPTWNNPVVRIVDVRGKDIVERLGNNYSPAALVKTICDAITSDGQIIPPYLSLLEKELSAKHTEEVYLSMYCFWTGEKNIGQLDGVLATEAGFMNGREVVRTRFDPKKTNVRELEHAAKKSGCADAVFTVNENYRPDKEVKYYLQHSRYKSIPMTEMQAMKVNADLGNKQNPERWLSPAQIALLEKSSNKNLIGIPLEEAWKQN